MDSPEIVFVPGISEAFAKSGAPISPAVKANGFVFVSGVPPLDLATGGLVLGDVALQADAAMQSLERILAAAGSSLEKVVKVTIFATNVAYFARINEVYRRYFSKNYPARTFVNVGSWPMEFDIEVECVAVE